MLFFVMMGVLVVWVIQRQWKMRKMLAISRKFKNKYVALPIVGHGIHFLGTGEDRMKMFQSLACEAIKSKYGLTSLWIGTQYIVLTCDPAIIERVSKVSLAKSLPEVFRSVIGDGLIAAPVHIWRRRRRILAPAFSLKNVNSYIQIFAEQSTVMVDCLKSRPGNGPFSIWNNISSYTMDSICQSALGVDIKAQRQSFHPFIRAFHECSQLLSAKVTQPWLQWHLLYKLLPTYQEEEKQKKIMHNFVNDTIKEIRSLVEHKNANNTYSDEHGEIKTFLENLIISSDSNGNNGYTDLELREELLVLLLAGTDTSAVGISFTIVMLSRLLEVQDKAYEEISTVFGNSNRPVTLEDLPRLKYIEALIKETMRLYPPVPIIGRQNNEDVVLCSGITLPAGSNTFINIWGVHRNPRYWGSDAEDFNPDRFLNGNISPRSAFIPFSFGVRNCIGYQYAMMSMKVAVTELLRNYKVLPPIDMTPEELKKPLRVEYSIMMKDVDNFNVRLEHRM